jgi:hypothetical protein
VYGKRAGAIFNEAELGAGIAASQIADNSESGMMEALMVNFSKERARAILAAMVGMEPVFIWNNCG